MPGPRSSTLSASAGWYVDDITRREALAVIEAHHYSKSGPSTGVLFAGLFSPEHELVGATIWLPPPRGPAKWLHEGTGCDYERSVNLSRMAIAPGVPTNAATFLLARCRASLRDAGYQVAITYADGLEGHTGRVYAADNWLFAGTSAPRDRWVDPEGRMRSSTSGNIWEGGKRIAKRNLTVAEMKARGWTRVPGVPKYRYIIALDKRFRRSVAAFAEASR